MNKEMIGWQSLYFISMFFGTLVSYLMPILFIKYRQQSSTAIASNNGLNNRQTVRILSACNCFAAGIFLGICFLNLIPYVEQEFSELFTANYEINFPVGQFTVILGLFLVLFLETIIMRCRHRSSPPILRLDEEIINDDSLHEEQSQELLEVPNGDKNSNNHRSNHINRHNSHSYHNHSHSHSHDFTPNSSSSAISFFILMFATSVHSVFEGLALGLQNDVTKALHLFIGIILHECLVAFALGLNSARIECSLKTNIRFAIVFSATIPIGIVLGVGLGYTPGLLGRIISAIFQGLAAGTFIHVTFHELIPSEFLSDNESDIYSNNKLCKIFLLFIGFIVMALMTLFTDSH